MRIEIIHSRDPDSPCDHIVFIDGRRVSGEAVDGRWVTPDDVKVDVYSIDPGAGYERTDWDDGTEDDCAKASPEVAPLLRSMRVETAENSKYVEG